ncbi:UvrD-helicase domain-containing protein [Desulfovibrio sp. OttesenSCG-928-M16]|nr:UvrD-helicase domain-containing protein [Desulfovibrio sp. OttesenSCG-928-M16]
MCEPQSAAALSDFMFSAIMKHIRAILPQRQPPPPPMQEYLADLHIHSRFSRATSRKLGIPLLAAWAGLKGLSVVGTGDFTHPVWREELATHLRYDEASGLYALADPTCPAAALPQLPVEALGAGQALFKPKNEQTTVGVGAGVRFMLQGEISSIYKRGGKVRKVHNLVFMPTLEVAEAFCQRLETLGNLHSDGRPILGLDSHDLLEMVLEAHPEAFLIPAHIWTPWFSLFGSKSGFDRLEDCYGDLSGEIFALETGLSSDPAMNRLWSALDGYRLISNSDAHSGEKLGREANVFAGELSYKGMLAALKHPGQSLETTFRGTLEFFPEEGKYHMDGHRKCEILLNPKETRALGGICPVCGGPLTVGVLSRVMELADRDEAVYQQGDGADGKTGVSPFLSLVPLAEILGEIFNVGPKSRKVGDMYAKALERFGPELTILRHTHTDDLARFFSPLGEAVSRMRQGRVHLQGGYDGEYGVVRMFSEQEHKDLFMGIQLAGGKGRRVTRGLSLPGTPQNEDAKRGRKKKTGTATAGNPDQVDPDEDFTFSSLEDQALPTDTPEESCEAPLPEADLDPGLNPEQERAVLAGPGPVLVLAGPGTGKTRTLVARILHLLEEGIGSRRIAAVTFTRRAATEMDARLTEALGKDAPLPRTDTLHALALELWHKTHADVPVLLSEERAKSVFAEANPEQSAAQLREAWTAVNLARERLEIPAPEFVDLAQRYETQKNAWNLADYTDLLEFWLAQASSGLYSSPWGHVLVDEVQDLSPLQLALVRTLISSSGEGFFGIGDPDQSIYGFRGAHGQSLEFFRKVWPGLEVIGLKRNYRSGAGILGAARAVLGADMVSEALTAQRQQQALLHLFNAPTAEAEAIWVANRVSDLLGLGSHTLADAKDASDSWSILEADHSPGDIVVLLRTRALAPLYVKALERKGVPVSDPAADIFWSDERVALIIRSAGRMLGIAAPDQSGELSDPVCPDRVFANGPLGVAAYLSAFPPFDESFSRSRAFRSLVRAYDANNGWAGLITWVSLQNELELVRAKGERVQVMTMHAAKGLEFRSVFLPALEDGLLPFAGSDILTGKIPEKSRAATHDEAAEELRLFYVALTRAKDALFLSHAGKRLLYGKELRLKPSRFLTRLPADSLSRSTLVAKTTRSAQQLRLI